MAFHPQPNALAEVTMLRTGETEHEGVRLSVPGAFTGERIAVRLLARQGKHWLCKIEQLVEVAKERREPPCPIWRVDCACPLMPLTDVGQAAHKRALVVEALGNGAQGVAVEPVVQAEEVLGYRSKVVLVSRAGKLGAYRRGSHAFMDLNGCIIEEQPIADAVRVMRRLLADVPSYDDRDGSGDLRYVVLRSNAIGEVLVTWIGSRAPPHAQVLMEQAPQVKGVLFAHNTSTGNAIWDQPPELLAGVDHLMEYIDGLHFRVSPQSFFQVHRDQAARLRDSLQLQGRVWDLYCGVGVNALSFAKRGHTVHGIEGLAAAVEDARDNAKRNRLDATFSVANLDDPNAVLPSDQPDAVVLNPPRKGAPLHLIERLVGLKPEHIIYVACAPKPVAAAAALLQAKGYVLTRVQPFDLFPQTEHVETVATFKLA